MRSFYSKFMVNMLYLLAGYDLQNELQYNSMIQIQLGLPACLACSLSSQLASQLSSQRHPVAGWGSK